MSKLVDVSDPTTGEYLGLHSLECKPVKRWGKHPYKRWLFMNQLLSEVMKTCKRSDDHRVFWHFISLLELGDENVVSFPLKETAEAMNMTTSQVSLAVKRLKDTGVLEYVEDTQARFKKYRLNANLGWMGATKTFPRGTKKWPQGKRHGAGTAA